MYCTHHEKRKEEKTPHPPQPHSHPGLWPLARADTTIQATLPPLWQRRFYPEGCTRQRPLTRPILHSRSFQPSQCAKRFYHQAFPYLPTSCRRCRCGLSPPPWMFNEPARVGLCQHPYWHLRHRLPRGTRTSLILRAADGEHGQIPSTITAWLTLHRHPAYYARPLAIRWHG